MSVADLAQGRGFCLEAVEGPLGSGRDRALAAAEALPPLTLPLQRRRSEAVLRRRHCRALRTGHVDAVTHEDPTIRHENLKKQVEAVDGRISFRYRCDRLFDWSLFTNIEYYY